MFRSQVMKKVSIIGLPKQKETVAAYLHEQGISQPIDLKGSEVAKLLQRAEHDDEIKAVADALLKVSRMVSILKLAPHKLSLPQKMFGLDLIDKHAVDKKTSKETLDAANSFLQEHADALFNLEDDYTRLKDEEEDLNEIKRLLDLIKQAGLPVNLLQETKKVTVLPGRVPTKHVHKLKAEIAGVTVGQIEFMFTQENKKDSIGIIIHLKEHHTQIQQIAKKHHFSTFALPPIPAEGKSDPLGWVKSEAKKIANGQQKIIEQIQVNRKHLFTQAVILKEELELLKEKHQLAHKILGSQTFFVLQGWVKDKEVKKLEKELTEKVEGMLYLHVEDPTEEDNVPVALTNPSYLKPFEMLTSLYGSPKYKELDPTFIVGPVFLVYAAFMLTDFVYGLLLFALGLGILFKFSKYSKDLKNVSVIITGFGFLTMLFGILTGSYFGDLPKYFIGKTSAELAFWRDPLADPLYFLIISLSVAVVHINIGLIMGVTEDWRKKDWKGMVKERLVWFALQVGIAFLFFPATAFVGKVILGITILTIIILSGPLGLLDITGLLGDMISYSRLFALSLSTAGIALAVNLLADMVRPIPYAGIVFAVLIFLVGHSFGFVMNAIGSFVHSLRLQFVEFFGKFYEGGGDSFTPFKEERVYTEVKK